MFKRKYSFFQRCLLSCRYVMSQKQYFELAKMGGYEKPLWGGRPPGPP